jgi:hypothetical protein
MQVYVINAPNRHLAGGIVPTNVATEATAETSPVDTMFSSQMLRLRDTPAFTGRTSLLCSHS